MRWLIALTFVLVACGDGGKHDREVNEYRCALDASMCEVE